MSLYINIIVIQMREEQAFCVGIAERMFKLPGKQP